MEAHGEASGKLLENLLGLLHFFWEAPEEALRNTSRVPQEGVPEGLLWKLLKMLLGKLLENLPGLLHFLILLALNTDAIFDSPQRNSPTVSSRISSLEIITVILYRTFSGLLQGSL